MKNNKVYVLICFLLITFISCEKDEFRTLVNTTTSEKNLNLAPLTQPLFNLPFKGENITHKERVYTRTHSDAKPEQEKAKDIIVKRYIGNNKWSNHKAGTSGNKNSDYFIYGKPIYAIANGTIVGGWRNAPENPLVGAKHPFVSQNLIPKGGNILWVKNTDGSVVLYAHMIPGSIPAALCPHNDASYPSPPPSNDKGKYTEYDEADQVQIVKGQFLGRVGNSGNSSEPHLHIHRQKNKLPLVMKFKKGTAKEYVKNNTKLTGGWESFNGQKIPDGEVLIDVPRSKPYRMFDFESYKVGNTRRYAGMFKPGSYNDAFYVTNNWSKFKNKRSELKTKGFRLIDFDTYKKGSKRRYAGIFKPGSYDSALYIRDSWTGFKNKRNELKSKGFRLVDFESYTSGSKRMYVGVFNPGSYKSKFYVYDNWTDFKNKRNSLKSQGFRLVDFESYKSGSKQMHAGIFKKASYTNKFYVYDNWADFKNKRNLLRSQGLRLVDFESYTSGSKQMYAGIFKPGSYTPMTYFKDDWEDFQEGWEYLK